MTAFSPPSYHGADLQRSLLRAARHLGQRARAVAVEPRHARLRWGGAIAAALVLLLAILIAAGGASYLQTRQPEPDDIDALVLASDLPIRAYTDQDFDAWLKGSSR